MSEPVLIWGGGAIGGTLAAYFVRAGHNVLMVDVVEEHVQRCAHEGLSITGPVDTFSQVIPAVTPAALEGTFGRIILAVKALHTKAATEALKPHLAQDGYVLSAQNGLNERMIAHIVGAERTMGAFVNFGADWHGPGEILFGNRGAVVVGEIDGSVRERTRNMHALLRLFEPDAQLTDNIWGYLWGKLGYGAMLIATALTPESMTANFADPQRVPAFVTLGREVIAVAHAEGVIPCGFNGFDPAAFSSHADDATARASIAALARFNATTAKTHSGVWRDLAVRKRKTEVGPQLGAVIDAARTHGLPCPALECLAGLITDIEEGRRIQSEETFNVLISACS